MISFLPRQRDLKCCWLDLVHMPGILAFTVHLSISELERLGRLGRRLLRPKTETKTKNPDGPDSKLQTSGLSLEWREASE